VRVCLRSDIASSGLFNLDRLEQAFKVSNSEALVIVSLNDFKEKSRSVLNWFGEDLK
jgi:hypothetical protein